MEIICGQIEEDVLAKYEVENKKGAYKGRGEPLEWRIVKRVKSYQPRNGSEDCWANISSFWEYSLQRSEGMQEAGNTKEEEEVMKQHME